MRTIVRLGVPVVYQFVAEGRVVRKGREQVPRYPRATRALPSAWRRVPRIRALTLGLSTVGLHDCHWSLHLQGAIVQETSDEGSLPRRPPVHEHGARIKRARLPGSRHSGDTSAQRASYPHARSQVAEQLAGQLHGVWTTLRHGRTVETGPLDSADATMRHCARRSCGQENATANDTTSLDVSDICRATR